MAGAGKRTFIAGEVLTAAQVNDYLMDQAVMRFSGSAARAASITAPTEGMVTYLDDTNRVEFYNGNRWITMIDSGVVTTKGDLFVASASATVTRVGAGTDGQFLTASSGAAAGVTWTTPGSAIPPYNRISKITSTNASWPVPTLAYRYARVTVIGGGGAGGSGYSNGNAGGSSSFVSGSISITAAGGAGGRDGGTPGGDQPGGAGNPGLVSGNHGVGGAATQYGDRTGSSGGGGAIEVNYVDLQGVSTVNITIGAGGTSSGGTGAGGAGGRGEVQVEYVA